MMPSYPWQNQGDWVHRAGDLHYIISDYLNAFPEQPTDQKRLNTLRCLLIWLLEFSREQIQYFDNITYTINQGNYPRECVFHTILNQVEYDFDVILQAIDQRNHGSTYMEDTLVQADKLAQLALNAAISVGLIPDNTVALTYFQKSPLIRVIPYANVSLIGIPLSSINTPSTTNSERGFLGIPHEIGHYVFRKGVYSNQRICLFLKNQIRQSGIYGARWVEEIFADIFSCVVGGPIVALSCQDLQVRRNQNDFILDDSDHPVPTIRPEIFTRVINRISSIRPSFTGWETPLDGNWSVIVNVRNSNHQYKGRSGQLRYIADLIAPLNAPNPNKPLDRLIELILDPLLNNLVTLTTPTDSPWYDYLSSVNLSDLGSLYSAFSSSVSNLSNFNYPPDFPCPSEGIITGPPYFSTMQSNWEMEASQEIDEWISDGKPVDNVPFNWEAVLGASGWAEKPQGQWRPPETT